jgi:hypothetical protein
MTDDITTQLTDAREAVATIDRNALDRTDCRVLLEIEDSLAGLERAYEGERDG